MSRKFKGFTIAELLISLLIISLVLSAAIPTLTRKKAGNEVIWQWSQSPNSAYFGIGEQQSAIIGNTYKPDGEVLTNFDSSTDGILENNKFVNSGDKLILVKKANGLSNAHISFYNIDPNTGTTGSVKYAGRLVLDQSNMGLGLGAIANSENPCSGSNCAIGNTAIGHYSLIANETGQGNTAIGYKTLVKNQSSYNTALGAYSGFETNGADALYNTSVGAFSLNDNKTGTFNTAVGFMALGTPTSSITDETSKGNFNTAIGAESCNYVTGNGNICIGYKAGSSDIHDTNIPSRYGINYASNNILYIGSSMIPLVIGRLEKLNDETTANTKRLFALNTQDFDVNTPMADYNVLRVTAVPDASSLNFIPYQTAAGASRQFKVTGDNNNGIYLNSQKYTATNTEFDKYGTLSLNGGRLLISEDDNGTTSITAGNGTNKTLGNYKINLTKDNISFFGNNSKKLVFKIDASNNVDLSSDTIINITTKTQFKGDLIVAGSNTYLNSANTEFNGGTSGNVKFNTKTTFNSASTYNANATFETGSIVAFKNDPTITGLKSAGAQGFTSASTDGIKAGIIALWNAISQLGTEIKNIQFQLSDARLKNITGNSTAGLKEINAIEVKNFTFKNDKEKKPHVGVIAQQLQKVFPNSVIKDDDGYLKINKDEMFYAMINSIKELFAKIQDLTAKVTGLDNRLKKLEQENAQLKKQNADFEARLKKLEAKTK